MHLHMFYISTGPPTPSSVIVSMAMNNSAPGLSVSWELDQEVYGSVQYHVTNNQNLTCNSTSSSCTMSPVGCGEIHTIQVTALNEAGPSYPSSPVVFITCEWRFELWSYIYKLLDLYYLTFIIYRHFHIIVHKVLYILYLYII